MPPNKFQIAELLFSFFSSFTRIICVSGEKYPYVSMWFSTEWMMTSKNHMHTHMWVAVLLSSSRHHGTPPFTGNQFQILEHNVPFILFPLLAYLKFSIFNVTRERKIWVKSVSTLQLFENSWQKFISSIFLMQRESYQMEIRIYIILMSTFLPRFYIGKRVEYEWKMCFRNKTKNSD